MSDEPDYAHSFTSVAAAYDRARPSYPREAAEWLTGTTPATVLELGAGTGKLTDQLVALGHDVLATDPLEPMLAYLRARRPDVRTAAAAAEDIPVLSHSVDVVISAQAFHWFDLDRALPEIARVLRPHGVLALVWNQRDERIPWVRRLGAVIGSQDQLREPAAALTASELFGPVEEQSFRFWQPLRRAELRDLVLSRSNIAVKPPEEREQVLVRCDDLYDEYGRGPDGLLLPYVTRCFRTHVVAAPKQPDPDPVAGPDDPDDGSLLFQLS
jgi:SAM-dependent methyltransferase